MYCYLKRPKISHKLPRIALSVCKRYGRNISLNYFPSTSDFHFIWQHSLSICTTHVCVYVCHNKTRRGSTDKTIFAPIPRVVKRVFFNKELAHHRPLFLFIFVLVASQLKCQIHNLNYINWKSIDVVHGIRTRGHRLVDADDSIELWW